MKAIYVAFLSLLTYSIMAQEVVQTITSNDFEQDGSSLIIHFEVPYSEDNFTYNFYTAHIFDNNNQKTELKTFSGDIADLKGGQSYKVVWEVLRDVDEFYSPKKVEIALSYTPESANKAAELAAVKRAQEERRLEQKQAAEAQRQQKEHWRRNKPFSIGAAGYGGYVHGILSDGDNDISSESGFGYGVGAFMEVRLGAGAYLQLEGAIMRRNFYFSNTGSNSEYNFYECEIFYDIDNAHIDFTDYRAYARLKLAHVIQLGAYYTLLQSADRRGELVYDAFCDNGTGHISRDPSFEYSFLDEKRYPEDPQGNSPIRSDYGFTVGIETPTSKNVVFSIGYDISLNTLLNNEYQGWQVEDNPDLYPADRMNFRLGYLYARFGVRL